MRQTEEPFFPPAIQANLNKRFDGKSCRLVRAKFSHDRKILFEDFQAVFIISSLPFCMWRALTLDWRSDEFFMKNTNYLRVDGWEFASLQNQFEKQQQRGTAGTWMENFCSCSIVLVIGSAFQYSAIARRPDEKMEISLLLFFSLFCLLFFCAVLGWMGFPRGPTGCWFSYEEEEKIRCMDWE